MTDLRPGAATLNPVQIRTRYWANAEKSANFTAENHAEYIITGTCTVTDPTPAAGHGFRCLIINGTATIGGVAYSTPGVEVTSYYHSGSWVRDARPTLGDAHTWTAAQTFRAASAVRSEAAATQDAVVLAGRAGGTSSYAVTLTPTTLTANRTITLTDATGTMPLLESAQTWTAAQTFSTTIAVTTSIGLGNKTLLPGALNAAGIFRSNSTASYWAFESSAAATLGYSGFFTASDFKVLDSAAGDIFRANTTAITCTYALTVPNGTAAAPGIRLTSEASGLYRIGATSIGVSVAGSLVLTVGSTASSLASGSTFTIANTTASTSTTTGSLTTAGGLGVAKAVYAGEAILSVGATHGVGYGTGAGGTVTQATSRTTGVTINKVCGQITLVSAAGTASWQSFTVTNSAVATTDVIRVCQDSGTDKYMIHVTAVGAGSFEITYATTGGTTTEQPVFSFAVVKAVTS